MDGGQECEGSARLAEPPPLLAAPRLRVGDLLAGRYVIRGHLGQGGFGVVYLVEQVELHKRFALKTILPGLLADEVAVRGFLREIEILAGMSHPNIVSIVDRGVTSAGAPFFVMEYVKGRSLLEVVCSEGPLAPERVRALGVALCRGVDAAHEQGILHRDLKPNNLLVSGDGDEERLTILDFGLSKAVDATEYTRAWTPGYVPPEVAAGARPDSRSDVFSAAATLHVLATATYPLGQAIEGATRTTPLEHLPPGLRAAILRGLSVRPERRYPSMRTFGEALAGEARVSAQVQWLRAMFVFLLVVATGLSAALAWSWLAAPKAPTAAVIAAATTKERPPQEDGPKKEERPPQEDEPKKEERPPQEDEPKKERPPQEDELKKNEGAPQGGKPKKKVEAAKKKEVPAPSPLSADELRDVATALKTTIKDRCAGMSSLPKVSGQLHVSATGSLRVTWFTATEQKVLDCLEQAVGSQRTIRASLSGGQTRVEAAL